MQALNFPPCSFRFKNRENKPLIFDPIRKKFVVLTPEEWVRQHLLGLLLEHHHYPAPLINVEKQIRSHHLNRRYDLVVYRPDGRVFLLAECKAPQVAVDQQVFDQVARYNYALKAPYLFLTNGLVHYLARIDPEKEEYEFLEQLPSYPSK